MRVKICGVTTVEAIEAAVAHGADAIGFVLTPSPRRLELAQAAELARHVPPFVARVAVMHEPPAELLRAVCEVLAPDVVQCEPSTATNELDRPFLPVFHDHSEISHEVAEYRKRHRTPLVHVEASGRGGRGIPANRTRARAIAAAGPIVLAGGLDPANVRQAIREVEPWAVDVSSGCESTPGIKDPTLVADFLRAAREATLQRDALEIRS